MSTGIASLVDMGVPRSRAEAALMKSRGDAVLAAVSFYAVPFISVILIRPLLRRGSSMENLIMSTQMMPVLTYWGTPTVTSICMVRLLIYSAVWRALHMAQAH